MIYLYLGSGFGHEFDDDARQHLLKRKFSDIICDNTDVEEVPSSAFRSKTSSPRNPTKRCDTNDVNSLDVTKINILSPFCDGTIPDGDWQCCTLSHPCTEGKGDCDRDEDCMPGLSCGSNNCKEAFSTGSSAWDSTADCCAKKNST